MFSFIVFLHSYFLYPPPCDPSKKFKKATTKPLHGIPLCLVLSLALVVHGGLIMEGSAMLNEGTAVPPPVLLLMGSRWLLKDPYRPEHDVKFFGHSLHLKVEQQRSSLEHEARTGLSVWDSVLPPTSKYSIIINSPFIQFFQLLGDSPCKTFGANLTRRMLFVC